MIHHHQRRYSVIQFKDGSWGSVYHYDNEYDPFIGGEADPSIKTVFRVKRKYKQTDIKFKLFGKQYEISIKSKYKDK